MAGTYEGFFARKNGKGIDQQEKRMRQFPEAVEALNRRQKSHPVPKPLKSPTTLAMEKLCAGLDAESRERIMKAEAEHKAKKEDDLWRRRADEDPLGPSWARWQRKQEQEAERKKQMEKEEAEQRKMKKAEEK
ncbi:hypothetical protein PMZ80_001859 [Knufia obscura]|uniref:Uncharacterized protein n=1 Tax=Knufia obscura TaxID=1635080 RepID=A0ABR0RWN0_9EURO|nr:hypothetical protein PMZ80_001859 [Knufia obscura]